MPEKISGPSQAQEDGVFLDPPGRGTSSAPARLVALPHVARQDIQFAAVFSHRAAGDRDAALFEDLHDLLVTERALRVFGFDEIGDGTFHAGVAHRFAAGGLVAWREEILHVEDA